MTIKKLPVGIEDFKELIENNYYYVDKTDFIAQTFDEHAVLYTRPCRFGKTLNMSMLKYFYSIKEKPENEENDLFQGLNISRIEEAKAYQNRYPVILLPFKDIEGKTFEEALASLSALIQEITGSFPELFQSDKLDEFEKKRLREYETGSADPHRLNIYLRFLSICLSKYYQEDTIILIDDYDAPLEKAVQYNYYPEMASFIRTFLSCALKTNKSMEKGILTGCLRYTEESIFSGLNNIIVYSVMDDEAASSFGFTEDEVEEMYEAYGCGDKLPEVRQWYDDYRFGNAEICSPKSVLLYLNALLQDPDARPVSYWADSDDNILITRCIENADDQMIDDLQKLADGKSITKRIWPNLSWKDMEDPDNHYSFLLLTGYLKAVKEGPEEKTWELKIPNLEVRDIYKEHFSRYFGKLKKALVPELLTALSHGEEKQATEILTKLLDRYISFITDPENFYHGFMDEILDERYDFKVIYSRKITDGWHELYLTSYRTVPQTMIVLEYKRSEDKNDQEKDSEAGTKQIQKKHYLDSELYGDNSIRIGYGISFYKKSCKVKKV